MESLHLCVRVHSLHWKSSSSAQQVKTHTKTHTQTHTCRQVKRGGRVGWHTEGRGEGLNYHRNWLDCSEEQQQEVKAEVVQLSRSLIQTAVGLRPTSRTTADVCWGFHRTRTWFCGPAALQWRPPGGFPLMGARTRAIWSKSHPGTGKLSVWQQIAVMQVFMSSWGSLYTNTESWCGSADLRAYF